MGKKVKKKARAPPREKLVAADSPKKAPQPSNPSVKDGDDGVSVAKERRPCPHVDKGFDLDKLSAKIGSSGPVRCEDCREGALDRRGGKGKGKHGKKKGSSSVDSKSESKAIWVCLECGHYSCGGIGLPTTPQCHAVRHARQTRHPIVIHFEKPQMRWCFPCNMLITIEKTEEDGEQKDVFADVVKLIKGHSSEGSSVNAEDVWFASGSVTSEIKSASNISCGLDGRGGYMVRGLVNLGNTCFFNSVLQNLLAIDRLRGYFLNLDASTGALTVSLKKLFTEAKPEAGLKNVINPRSLFGCVCSKASQFRGYQQQDSHELLRCLLDGLCTEELSMRKRINSSQENGNPSNSGPTFVEAAFGGQTSSTVCCVECGHSSIVYESFLDLSLSVPTRKSPSKAAQPTSRAKKTKLPPKRSGKLRPKNNKEKNSVPSPSVPTPSTSGEVSDHSDQPQSSSTDPNVAEQKELVVNSLSAVQESPNEQVCEDAAEQTSTLLDDCSGLDYLDSGNMVDDNEVCEDAAEQTSTLLDDCSWLDYLDSGNMLDDNDFSSQNNDVSIVQDSENKSSHLNDVSLQSGSESSNQVFTLNKEPNVEPDRSSVNSWEEELPLQVQDSEVLLLPYKAECSTTEEIMGGEGEASSSVVGCGQDDFGFGDLFNEPEVYGPPTRPSVGEGGTDTSIIASESDPDEVDDTDSPVSVESCLTHFIRPELLANENAWHCENCSKILQRQRLEGKKQGKSAAKVLINGCEARTQSDSLSLNTGPADVRRLGNGNVKSNTGCNQFGENFVLHDGKINCLNQNCSAIENCRSDKSNSVVCQRQDEMEDAPPVQSNTSDCTNACSLESFSDQVIDSRADESRSASFTCDIVPQTNYGILDGHRESEESEDEEVNSKRVNVKRNATKRYLINRAPPILTIHLKRFSQDARGRLSKLNGHISFQEKIDLRPYMDSRCTDGEKYEYQLLGVVEHSGTMRGGHYVAYVRGGERSRGKTERENTGHAWYYASDAHVRQVPLDDVLRAEAYILFYEKT
ncbi:hypothetical protein ACFX15_030905 [Malus domestica]|uniref:ubiquitin carboxyl-terminal hydrolase 2-like n=1 Tax=Malus sylvestris TaxID=3752 RepID=UPI0021ABF225|nr:ubiquitin carboxyl-terminal hydrolase 2-like [Malus sylvestris]